MDKKGRRVRKALWDLAVNVLSTTHPTSHPRCLECGSVMMEVKRNVFTCEDCEQRHAEMRNEIQDLINVEAGHE